MQFVAVTVTGGLISGARFGDNLPELARILHRELDNYFDADTDDARIFDENGDEVYVYPTPGYLEENGLDEYLCGHCDTIYRDNVDSEDDHACPSCGMPMVEFVVEAKTAE